MRDLVLISSAVIRLDLGRAQPIKELHWTAFKMKIAVYDSIEGLKKKEAVRFRAALEDGPYGPCSVDKVMHLYHVRKPKKNREDRIYYFRDLP